MNRNQVFQWVSQYAWPLLRPFVSRPRRCRRCILSDRCCTLEDGLCPECRQNTSRTSEVEGPSEGSAQSFAKLIEEHLDRRGVHAVLLLSGGKDSVYVLDRLRREYPRLRMLCVTVNNGFMSPLAIDNARFAVETLGVDWMLVNGRTEAFAEGFRKAFLSLDGRGTYGVIDRFDGDLIFDIARTTARDLNIPLMISGLSWVQLDKIFGIHDIKSDFLPGVTDVFPLAVWRTDEQTIRLYVRQHRLMPPGGDSPIVSNNELILAMAVIDVLNLGYSSFEPEFAQLVREKKTDRSFWLNTFEFLEFAVRRGLLTRELEKTLSRFDLTIKDVVGRPR